MRAQRPSNTWHEADCARQPFLDGDLDKFIEAYLRERGSAAKAKK